MTTPSDTPPTSLDLQRLVADFMLLNPLVDPWSDGELEDSEDCDVLSRAFTAHCRAHGVEARTVRVTMSSPHEAMLDVHYFTVLGVGLAVDFTARQFHNVAGMPLGLFDIECPLVFLWPGAYPLPTLEASFGEVVD